MSASYTNYSFERFDAEDLTDADIPIGMLQCIINFYNVSTPGVSCNATWDGLSCWPPTRAKSLAVIPCMEFLNFVPYDTTENATRECGENGVWAQRSNYTSCRPLFQSDESLEVLWDTKETHTIYSIGYGLSLVALTLALWIFLYFRDLRCQRNTIHVHLLVTYLCIDLTWIVTAALQMRTPSSIATQTACYLVIFLTYFMVTNFFWMFVEGLYLYILVVKTFSVDSVKLKTYVVIGWGVPAVATIPWAVLKSQYISSEEQTVQGCPWQNKDYFDYVFMCPVIFVLLVNIYFLSQIMWVLITKLRASNNAESKQYRKAAKALLVLIPLLGMTYIVVIVTPTHRIARVVFSYAQAILLSTQGFTVAVLYCFLNGEVRKSVRHHLEQWRDRQTLTNHRHLRLNGNCRGRQDSAIPSCPANEVSGRRAQNRTSCISLSTSYTWVSNSQYSNQATAAAHRNGSYNPVSLTDDI